MEQLVLPFHTRRECGKYRIITPGKIGGPRLVCTLSFGHTGLCGFIYITQYDHAQYIPRNNKKI